MKTFFMYFSVIKNQHNIVFCSKYVNPMTTCPLQQRCCLLSVCTQVSPPVHSVPLISGVWCVNIVVATWVVCLLRSHMHIPGMLSEWAGYPICTPGVDSGSPKTGST